MKFGSVLVWTIYFPGQPIAALSNDLSANRKGVFSVRFNTETGFKSQSIQPRDVKPEA
jgi:hypothetical protein